MALDQCNSATLRHLFSVVDLLKILLLGHSTASVLFRSGSGTALAGRLVRILIILGLLLELLLGSIIVVIVLFVALGLFVVIVDLDRLFCAGLLLGRCWNNVSDRCQAVMTGKVKRTRCGGFLLIAFFLIVVSFVRDVVFAFFVLLFSVERVSSGHAGLPLRGDDVVVLDARCEATGPVASITRPDSSTRDISGRNAGRMR